MKDILINCYNKRLFWIDLISKFVEVYGVISKGKCIKFKRFLVVIVLR